MGEQLTVQVIGIVATGVYTAIIMGFTSGDTKIKSHHLHLTWFYSMWDSNLPVRTYSILGEIEGSIIKGSVVFSVDVLESFYEVSANNYRFVNDLHFRCGVCLGI